MIQKKILPSFDPAHGDVEARLIGPLCDGASPGRLKQGSRSTPAKVGGGVVAQLTPAAAVWGMVDYTTDIAGSQERQIIRGNAGMKLTW